MIPIKEKTMEEYITSIRSGAITVAELIALLQQLNPTDTIYISLELQSQLDIYKEDDTITIR